MNENEQLPPNVISEGSAPETAASKPAPAPPADIENIIPVTIETLISTVEKMAKSNLRFITASCLDCGETFEIYYHFAEDIEIRNLLLSIPRDAIVPSISGVYFAAFLVENEIKELFGVNITDIAIDYGGRLLLTSEMPSCPMAKSNGSAVAEM